MAGDEKIIYVYDNFFENVPVLLGRLYVGVIKGGETYSFEYDANWLKKSLLVDDEDNSISIDLAIRTAPRFGISEVKADEIAREMLSIVRGNWERMAKEYGLSRGQIEYMRPAFSECY